ncbi:MAG: LCP family protein [Lachnospiraceae bacterium]|nr:LCP family protein [Lachnospiraceae bacterium]
MKDDNYGDELFEIVGDPGTDDAPGSYQPDNDEDMRIVANKDAADPETTAGEMADASQQPADKTGSGDDTRLFDDGVELSGDGNDTEQTDTGKIPEQESLSAEDPREESFEDVQEENLETVEEPDIENSEAAEEPDNESLIENELSSEEEFAEELDFVEHEQQDAAIMEEIGDSIINQVEKELVISGEKGDMDGSDAPAGEGPGGIDIKSLLSTFFTGLPRWVYVCAGSLLILIISLVWVFASKPGQKILIRIGSRYIAGKVTYEPAGRVEEIPLYEGTDLAYYNLSEEPEVIDFPDDFEVITPEPTPTMIEEEDTPKSVYNILILGEENIDSGSSRGRSDLIMIASINLDQRRLKLTSVLRDSLVSIPNHSDNRINAAYTIGGVSLMYDTFRVNFGIEFDNYMLVNFENFENIINAIGGVDVELTEEEAKYLNRTNYISKEEYRNVTPGVNHMNGNQALGYCRIRKVETKEHLYSDIGRTSRQRKLLRSIFSSISSMGYVEMASFAKQCLGYLRTDLTSEEIERYLTALSEIGMTKIEECRIPVEGSYYDVRLRGMLVTNVDLKTNAEALRTFIYGK